MNILPNGSTVPEPPLVTPAPRAPQTEADPNVIWSHARRTAERWGLSLVPVVKGGKAPAGGVRWNDLTHGHVAHCADDVDRMWGPEGQWHGYNAGVLHRPELRTLALDIDMKHGKDGKAALQALNDKWAPKLGALPATLVNITPTNGEHHVYRVPDDWIPDDGLPYAYGRLGRDGVDVLWNGKQNVWSGSWLNSTVNAPYRLRTPALDPAVLSADWANTILYGSPDLRNPSPKHVREALEEPVHRPRGHKMSFTQTLQYLRDTYPHNAKKSARLNGMNSDGSPRTDWHGIVYDACERLKNAGPGNFHRAYGQQVFRLLSQGMFDDPGSIDWDDAFNGLSATWEHVLKAQGWYDPTAQLNRTETWVNMAHVLVNSDRADAAAAAQAWATGR